jgi:SpoVK/Ycf46/Vps4 family AAA+-type ATPase
MLLQLLDGNTQFDNVVTIATTNYPQILEKRFTCRPSRFNLVIEYKKPNDEVRRSYITMKLKDAGFDVESTKVKKDIERLVGKTEGYTFDFVKEVIQGIYVDQIDEKVLFDRLNDIIKKNGRVCVSEEETKKIGFSLKESDKSCGYDEPRPISEEKESESICEETWDGEVDEDWACNNLVAPATEPKNRAIVRGFKDEKVEKLDP